MIEVTDETREPKEPSESVRTCAGCRARDARAALLRFVESPDGVLIADVKHVLPGRGVSVHPKRACVEAAVTRGGFARALRHEVTVDWRELARDAADQIRRRAMGLVVAAWRSRQAAVGTDAVRDAMRSGKVELLVVAADAAGRRDELEAAAKALGRACVVAGTKEELGRLLGRGDVGVLAILHSGIADELSRALGRATELSEDA